VCFIPDKAVMIAGSENYSPIYNGNRDEPEVALMFNVYEGTDVVNKILDILKKYNAKATFFVGGCWADDNGETLIRILSDGHEIGSHGYFHKDMKKLTEEQNEIEIVNTEKLVLALTGYKMTLFAPPSGSFSNKTLKVAEKLGYKTIMWSKDTVDWRDKSVETVYNRATKNIQNGDFVLMHPKAHTAEALAEILTYYGEKGIRAVTVSECIGMK